MYTFSKIHLDHSCKALEALLVEGSLNRFEKRKLNRLLDMSDRRYARRMEALAVNSGMMMFEGFEAGFERTAAMAASPESFAAAVVAGFGAFIDIVQNWINFFIENQDKIMAIVNFLMKFIIPLFIISYAAPWFMAVATWLVGQLVC